MSKNTCCTYFRVTGDFDPDLVTERLGLQPDKFWKIGDKRRNGTEYDFASWEIGHCEEYDVLTENQMHKTIAPLIDKIDRLNEIRSEFNVVFTFEIDIDLYVEQV